MMLQNVAYANSIISDQIASEPPLFLFYDLQHLLAEQVEKNTIRNSDKQAGMQIHIIFSSDKNTHFSFPFALKIRSQFKQIIYSFKSNFFVQLSMNF